jgi:hypothetical protein
MIGRSPHETAAPDRAFRIDTRNLARARGRLPGSRRFAHSRSNDCRPVGKDAEGERVQGCTKASLGVLVFPQADPYLEN